MNRTIGTDTNLPDTSPLQIFNVSGTTVPLSRQNFETILRIVELQENIQFSLLELVFVDEEEIIRINRDHLNRSYVTDIISFSYSNEDQVTDGAKQAIDNSDFGEDMLQSSDDMALEGTLYCCAQRIAEQADELSINHTEEFSRVFIHGLLHLAGYDDKSQEEKRQMTSLEDIYLSLFQKSGN